MSNSTIFGLPLEDAVTVLGRISDRPAGIHLLKYVRQKKKVGKLFAFTAGFKACQERVCTLKFGFLKNKSAHYIYQVYNHIY